MDEKIYFVPGQKVTLRQDIPNKPIMLVHRVERSIIRNEDKNALLKGVNVRLFTENWFLQEAVFSTKDLILVD